MRAITYTRNGGWDVLGYGEQPDPQPGPRDVAVRVAFISIEGGDILNRKVTPPPHTPFIPGYQAAGTIHALGPEVSELAVGQRVVAFNWSGSHAELMQAPAHYVFAVPDALDLKLAATIPVPFGTAHDALFEFGRLQAGATVIGTSSSDERLEALKQLGLDHGINHRSQKIGEVSLALTGGKGMHLVLDLAGGPAVAELLDAARYRGRYAVVGASTGDAPSFGFWDLIRKSLTLFGVSFGREMQTLRGRALVSGLIEQAAAGRLTMPIDRVYPLAEASAAHELVETGHPFGRVVMHP